VVAKNAERLPKVACAVAEEVIKFRNRCAYTGRAKKVTP